jgi:hypothetical protein
MSGYYTTQNGIQNPGNFGIMNSYKPNFGGSVTSYSGGSIPMNNAGVISTTATVSNVSNVMVALAQPQQVANNINGNVVDSGIGYATLDGTNGDAPVNTIQNIMNNNRATQKYDRQTIAHGSVTLSMYPNGVAGPGYGPTN